MLPTQLGTGYIPAQVVTDVRSLLVIIYRYLFIFPHIEAVLILQAPGNAFAASGLNLLLSFFLGGGDALELVKGRDGKNVVQG